MTLFLVMLTSIASWATGGTLAGSGTSSDPYVIVDADDWGTFVNWINNSNSTYASKCYKLDADITISSMAGTKSGSTLIPFKGTFDGNGHTITLNDLTSTDEFCAPFRYVDGATFKRIHTTGTVIAGSDKSKDKYRTGLVGDCRGTTTITNCWSSVAITSEINEDGTHGGFVGVVNGGTLTITNCLFDGSITGTKTWANAGFVGWTGGYTTNITNCLMLGTINDNPKNGATFMRGNEKNSVVNSADNIKVNNSYYNETHGTVQGTAIGSMTNAQLQAALGEGWEISGDKVIPIISANNLVNATVTGLEMPLKWTGSVINVNYTVKDAHENVLTLGTDYTATISPAVVQNEGEYTLTLTGINSYNGTKTVIFKVLKQLNGEGTESSPYLINSSADWDIFANNVNEGNPYSGKFVKLNANDVIATTMVGTGEYISFQGTFLGNNKTLTVNLTGTEDGCAPFFAIKDATIKDLNIAGTITTGYKYGASLAVHNYGTSIIENCVSSATITSTFTASADGTHGGFAALNEGNATLTFTNCVFEGKLLGSNAHSNGGFVGYNGGTKINYNNCLFKPAERTMSTSSSYTFNRNGNTSINGAYYVSSFGSTQGVQVYAGVQTAFCKKEITYNATDYYSKSTPSIGNVNDSYAYTGSVINITPTVSYNSTTLAQGTDYEYAIDPATVKESGVYTLTITGKGNYAGTYTKKFSVAYVFSGEGTSANPYLINNSSDWDHFAENVTNGNNYYGKTFKLAADITVTTMAGSSTDNSFKGTFDGDGHTMTLNLTATGDYCAPFRYASNAKFKRLHVTGTINTAYREAGGIVGYFYYVDGTSFANCWSSVTINSTNKDYTSISGGFVGYNYSTVSYLNCLFDGSLSGSDSYGFGGFAGCADYSSNFTNCLFAPTSLNVDTKYGGTFGRKINSITNCYYTETLGAEQGTAVGSMTNAELQQALGNGWEIKNNKVVPILDIKNLNAGSIECNTFFPYTGSEITVTPTVKDMDGNTVAAENYSVSFSPSPVLALGSYTMTVNGNANGYSGTLTHQFQVANQLAGTGTQDDPFLIGNTDDWNTLAAAVAGGITYSGKYIKLTNDITVSRMVGIRDKFPFRGIFDGDNHTITANIVSTATGNDMNEQGVAPFHYINSATIKNLTVAGSITSASLYAAGLVGWPTNGSHINDCVVTATITTSADYAGGFVGNIYTTSSSSLYFNNCVFAGTINNTSSNANRRAGGFFGYDGGYTYFTNCLENGTYTNITMMNPRGGYNSFYNESVTSLYYVNKIGDTGKYITDGYGCHQVTKTAPTKDIYLAKAIHGYDFYQPVLITGLYETYPYNNDEELTLNYALKLDSKTLTKDTDYEVAVSPNAPAAIGNYTITFTAKADNETGYVGAAIRSFRVMEGESIDGYVFATEGEGNDKVYLINDESDLQRLAAYVNSGHDGQGKTFKQNADITLAAAHTSIGGYIDGYYRYFKGTFDGNNKAITNLTINKPSFNYQGLFGYINEKSVIKNVNLVNCNITGKSYTGGIAGSSSSATIQNCHVSGTIAATVADATYHGGIVGHATGTTITDCTMTGAVTTSVSNNHYGGIVGRAGWDVIFTSCENAAAISGDGERHGGIVGDDDASSNRFNLCLNTGTVAGTNYVGGIAGDYSGSNHYTNCYYASPCTVKALGSGSSNWDSNGNAERGYLVTAGAHINNIVAAETGVVTSALSGKKYYKKGDWTLTLTPDLTDATFITYACEGGTLTNLETVDGDHKLTITDKDITISAIVSSNSGVDMSTVNVAAIADKRWKGSDPVIPALTVTNGTTPLVLGTDYIVEGTNNTAIGEATLTLTGINGYKGTKEVTFNIVDLPLLDAEKTNSSENPYLIATEEDLEALASIVNTDARRNGYYKQTADITLTEEHTAIGIENKQFNGHYDGDNKTISGLFINKPKDIYQGLFGYIYNATIQNVKVIDCDITAQKHVGAIVGYTYSATIKDCFTSGEIKTAVGAEGYNHGGICGYLNGTVDGCVSTVTLTGNGTYSQYYGGLTGYYSSGSLKNSFFAGTVEGTSYVGSIAGDKSSSYSITNCYHTIASTGGIGSNNSTTGTDRTSAEVVAKITAADGVTLTVPAEPTYVWNAENLYKSGTKVTLNYAVPDGKVFDHYTVNSGEISNAGIIDGEHTLTGFSEDVVITGSYADNIIDLATAGAVIANIDNLTFNGLVQHPVPVVTLDTETLEENNQYTVSYSDGCTNVGTYTITVTGSGRYSGSVSKDFTIDAFNIGGDGAIVISGLDAEYAKTGSAIHPVPTAVKCAATNNATLVLDTDYELSYSDGCTVPGNYEVTLTGKGNYTGTKSVEFSIVDVEGLTVHDKTNTSDYLPLWGVWADDCQKNEFIMPASELAAMKEKSISTMKFYLKNKASEVWKGTFQVFLKEVENTEVSGYSGTDGATIVYEGSLDGTNDVMTVSFATPYYYKGGNLLIGFYKLTENNCPSASFYGEVMDYNASIYAHDWNINNITSGTLQKFLPKTTFWYATPAEVPVKMNEHGIMTYASPYNLDFNNVKVDGVTSNDLKAYYASSFESTTAKTGVLTMTKAEEVPAGEGLMLKGTANETFYVSVLSDATPAALTNLLVGLTTATEVNTTAGDKTNFILSNKNDVIAWYPLAATYTLKAHSAYLQLITDDVMGARAITMDFGDGEATGIDQITDDAADGDWYSIDGQKYDKKPTKKGVYVTNGHKVVIK